MADRTLNSDERMRAAEALLASALGDAGEGAALDLEALCAQRPDLAVDLRRLHAAWTWLEHSALGCDGASAASCPLTGLHGAGRCGDSAAGSDRYQVLDTVAHGGMGTIFKVWDTRLRRAMAMKVAGTRSDGTLPQCADNPAVRRFVDEARVMSELDHPGVVPVHDLCLDEAGRLYFTMRLVDGIDFGAVVDLVRSRSAGWSLARAVEVLVKVCETVAYAHAKNIVHRDLKPANVMVGHFGQVYVMDWGLARVLGRPRSSAPDPARARTPTPRGFEPIAALFDAATPPEPTLDGTVIGTPAYMPPEQARGDHDAVGTRADVYAVGAMLYHLLVHRAPFSDVARGRDELLEAARSKSPTPLRSLAPDTPAELVSVCEKAMAREPDSRYGSMLEVAEDLRAYLEHGERSARRPGAGAPTNGASTRRRRRTVVLIACATGLAVALAVATSLLVRERDRAERLGGELASVREAAQASSVQAHERGERAEVEAYAARLAAAQAALEQGRAGVALELLDRCPNERRGFEWRHLRSRVDQSVRTFGETAHESIGGVAFSSDGARVLRTTVSGAVEVCAASNGETVGSLTGLRTRGSALMLTPDGRWIVGGDVDGNLNVWNADSSQSLRSWPGHPGEVWDLAVHPSSPRFASGARDGSARLWSLPDGQLLAELRAGGGQVFSVDFDPSGRRLLAASEDGRLLVWDVESAALAASHLVRPFKSNQWWPARFSPDGERIVHGTHRGDVEVRDATTFELETTLSGHDGFAQELRFASATLLVSSSFDSTIRLWSTLDWRCLRVLRGHGGPVLGLAVDRAHSRLLSGALDGTAKLWELEPVAAADFLPGEGAVEALAARDNLLMVFASGWLTMWNTATRERLWSRDGYGRIGRAQWSVDGERVVVSDGDGNVALLAAADGGVLANCPGPRDGATAAIHPDGERVASAGAWDNTLRICRPLDGTVVESIDLRTGLWSVDFSPDGKLLAVGDQGGRIRIRDVERREWVRELDAHTATVFELRFSRDGAQLASASFDRTAAVWDTASWTRRATLVGHSDYVLTAAFNRDATRVVTSSADTTVRIWDARTGTQLLCWIEHGGWVNDVLFAPDDSWVASAGSDTRIGFWRAP